MFCLSFVFFVVRRFTVKSTGTIQVTAEQYFGQLGKLVIALNHQHCMPEMLHGGLGWNYDGHRIQITRELL